MVDPRKIRPPQIVMFLYVVVIILQITLKPVRIIPADDQWLGYVMTVLGFGFMLWARQLFVKHGTPVRHSESPSQFVQEGPYRFTRNPMYVGGLVMFTGIAVWVGTWPFFVVPMVMYVVLDRIFIPWEEKLMAGIFQEPYRQYLKRTCRWLSF